MPKVEIRKSLKIGRDDWWVVVSIAISEGEEPGYIHPNGRLEPTYKDYADYKDAEKAATSFLA